MKPGNYLNKHCSVCASELYQDICPQCSKREQEHYEKFLTKVVHCKKEPYDIYIGRPSKWGNPFKIGVDGTRDEVLEKYKIYMLQNQYLKEDLKELVGKTLGCWCKPKYRCHGDILIELIEELL